MRLPKRDLIASSLVATAGLIYLLWLVGVMTSTRGAGLLILACGFAASAGAVVPTFDRLLRGNKVYLVLTSLIGVLALLGGAVVLFAARGTALTLVMAAMVVLWAIATVHHLLLAAPSPARETHHTSGHGPQPTALSR